VIYVIRGLRLRSIIILLKVTAVVIFIMVLEMDFLLRPL